MLDAEVDELLNIIDSYLTADPSLYRSLGKIFENTRLLGWILIDPIIFSFPGKELDSIERLVFAFSKERFLRSYPSLFLL